MSKVPRMSRRRRKHPSHHAAGVLNEEQRRALIPGGAVNPHRARRDEIRIETRALTARGAEIVTGERVIDAVRRLLLQGDITQQQADAARRFQNDHELAYESGVNTLAAVLVDSRRKSGDGAIFKLQHAQQFQKARAFLGRPLDEIAMALILAHSDSGIAPTLTGAGGSVLRRSPPQGQREAGRALLVVICQRLEAFYGRLWRPQRGSAQ